MSGQINYPIVLVGGRSARLSLPSDLTRADVTRIVAVLQTLVPEEATPFDGKGVLQDGSTPERMR